MWKKLALIVLFLFTIVSPGLCQSPVDATEPSSTRTVRELASYERETRTVLNQLIGVYEGNPWESKTSAYTAVAGDRLLVDTTDGAVTITLPATATVGDNIWVADKKNMWGTNNVTVGRNGHNIQGSAADLTLSSSGIICILVYSDATYGWTALYTSATAATESIPGIIEIATTAEVATGTDNTKAVSPAGLTSRAATTSLAGIVELATSAETQAGSDSVRAVTPAGLAATTSTETRAGVIELATTAEAQAGSDAVRAITPASLAAVTATETRAGVIELATTAEAQALADTSRAITPATLAAVTATATRTGVVELATDAETQTGTDTTRAITPANLTARTATETRAGILETATDVEAAAKSATDKILVPSNVPSIMASPGAIGSTTASTGKFTTLQVTSGTPAIGKVIGATDTNGNTGWVYPGSIGYVSSNLIGNATLGVCTGCTAGVGTNIISDTAWTGASGATPPTGWSADAGAFDIVGSGYSGNCLKVTTGAANYASMYKIFTIDPTKAYTITGYLKGGNATYSYILVGNSDGGQPYYVRHVNPSTTTAWTAISVPFYPAGYVTSARVTVYVSGTSGTYDYVDDLSISEMTLSGDTAAKAPEHWAFMPNGGSFSINRTAGLNTEMTYVKLLGGTGTTSLSWPDEYTRFSPIHTVKFAERGISFGAWLRSSDSNAGRVCIYDNGAAFVCSSYVTNDGEWHWMYVNDTADAGTTVTAVYIEAAAGTEVDVSSPTFIIGSDVTSNSFFSYNRDVVLHAPMVSNAITYMTAGSGSIYSLVQLFGVGNGKLPPDVKHMTAVTSLECAAGGYCGFNLGFGVNTLCPASTICYAERTVANVSTPVSTVGEVSPVNMYKTTNFISGSASISVVRLQ